MQRVIRGTIVWIANVLLLGLLLFSYRHLDRVMTGLDKPWAPTLACEMSSAIAVGILYFPVAALVYRWPWTRARWRPRLAMYLGACVAFCIVHTTAVWGMRIVAFPLLGLGSYDYGEMPLRYAMEAPMQVIGYTVIVIAVHAARGLRSARERELRLARLQSSLAHAQIDNLRLQLQPHFLFNALNTISSTMYRDPRLADELMQDLGDLLRASLRTAQSHEVALREELAILEHYVALQRARFGDRLRVRFEIDEDAKDASVPSLLLQPLVENAVRHGNAARVGAGTIVVRARRLEEGLCIDVEDDGPGASAAELDNGGVGLSATRARLRLLYGDAHEVEASRIDGGFRVRIVLPEVRV
jgi:two-component system LytT family sensor kinase